MSTHDNSLPGSSKPVQNLVELKRARGFVRTKITKLCNKCEEEADELSPELRILYLSKCKNLFDKISDYDDQIFQLNINANMSDEDLNNSSLEDESYSEKLESAMATLGSGVPNGAPDVSPNGVTGDTSFSIRNRIKLPQVPLPKYSNGVGENLNKFFRSFEAIVDKHRLASYEKFVYLREQLSEAPKILIDSLDVNNQSYEKAKALLIEAFDSTDQSKHDLIKTLANLKMHAKSDPYQFIGDMRTVIDGVKNLGIVSEDFLQYFVWKGLNEDFQSHLTSITNKFKPTLDEINRNVFEATERYLKQVKTCVTNDYRTDKTKSNSYKPIRQDASSMAVNIKGVKSSVFCVLCSADKRNSDHYLKNCTVYPNSKTKFDKLRIIKGCTKCSFNNHQANQCKFQFKSNCRYCEMPHMSYLCLKAPPQTAANSICDTQQFSEVANNLSFVEASQLSTNDPMILPTLTAYITYEGGKYPVRIFKDGGCQKTFICSKLATSLNLPVINDNVPLTIRGFNSNKNINTKLVGINLTVGGNTYSHNGICVDTLRTKFSTDGLSDVVSTFVQKGYSIADVNFYSDKTSESVENIDIILGTDSDHMLAMTYETFGDVTNIDEMSSFIQTPIGVIFSGNVTKMKMNLPYLPVKTSGDKLNELKYPYLMSSITDCFSNISILGRGVEGSVECTDCSVDQINSFSSDHEISFGSGKENAVEEGFSEEFLAEQCKNTLNICDHMNDEVETETNVKLVNFVLDNTTYDGEGRLVMPLTWNNKNSHLLSQNYALSHKLLQTNLEKLRKDPVKIKMYNDVIKEQLDMEIIEKIDNLDQFLLEHPEASFLPHQGIFRLSNETTKCRIVFLSNMFEKKNYGVSHNMAMLPGPNLNHKISTAVLLTRFDAFLITFDIQKAFLNIKLFECDQNRLCFLWCKNIERGDFTVVGYKNLRLSFGLRPSPTILMLGLYKILIMDQSGDEKVDNIKRAIYNGIYMDNGNFTCNNEQDLLEAYRVIDDVFQPHKLKLQQFCTNSLAVQEIIDSETDTDTPSPVKFFGISWDRNADTLNPMKIALNINASTKRQILASLNGVYDIYNVYAPILLRAKLFMQSLLTDQTLTWDQKLSDDRLHEWTKIVNQANSTPEIPISRCVGDRTAVYGLIGFTDASKDAYGIVVYLQCKNTGKVSYLTAKNRLINTATSKKTIPSLEFQAITFGVKTLYDVYQSLCGDTVVLPVNISSVILFTDSSACLHWIQNYSINFEKLRNVSVFVKNRLRVIDELCNKVPVTFFHVSGENNPADYLTRPASYKTLIRSNYFEGPEFLSTDLTEFNQDLMISLPNPNCKPDDEVPDSVGCAIAQVSPESVATETPPVHVIPLDRFSSFSFLTNVLANVLKFVRILKDRVNSRLNGSTSPISANLVNFHLSAVSNLLRTEQKNYYEEIYSYLDSDNKYNRDMPELIKKYNIFRDSDSILRIQSKFGKDERFNPILLPNSSSLTTLIIKNTHDKMSHSGVYSIIRELRKEFWIEKCFSAVKKVIKSCITCKKIHERPIKLNQSLYRKFRREPPRKPFKSVFIDYIGPFSVNLEGKKRKVYLLAISCLWSRSTNLEICRTLNVSDFLRAIQTHCYKWGLFESCISDLGSQLQSGAHLIRNFLSDFETKKFLSSNGINDLTFQHYAKGNSALGSLIESCVKQVKFLIYKSIKTTILDYFDFQFIVDKTVNLINKRPVAFGESLRSLPPDQVPTCVTPEMLMRGFDCVAVNVIPQLQPIEDDYDPKVDSVDVIRSEHDKLRKVRERLVEYYHADFITNLISQAVDKSDRYKPVTHKSVKPGDIVLLVDKYLKRYHYPMGRVTSVETNSLGEVTAARVIKGDTRESVYRHVTSLILLISMDEGDSSIGEAPKSDLLPLLQQRPVRKAAVVCSKRNAALIKQDLM